MGAVGLDVYEGEAAYFFADSSHKIIQDDTFARLLTFYNVFVRYAACSFYAVLFKNIRAVGIKLS
jgi:D-lactate dehydrogenase